MQSGLPLSPDEEQAATQGKQLMAMLVQQLQSLPDQLSTVLVRDDGSQDIARALGTVGHVTMLRRTRAGPFTLAQAISLDKLADAASARALEDILLPLRAGLDDIPALPLTPDQAGALRQGRVLTGIATDDGPYFACDGDTPVALVSVEDQQVRVVRGFNL